MAQSLAQSLIAAHLEPSGSAPAAAPRAGAALRLRVDHVLVDEADALLAFLAFESLGVPRIRCDLALVRAERPRPLPESVEALTYLQSAAARWGVHFARTGAGLAHALHAQRFAAPGRAVLSTTAGAAASAALGALVFTAGALEAAVAMGSGFHRRPMPDILGVRLSGALPSGVTGLDLGLELRRRLGGEGARGAVLEYFGPGWAGLSQADRAALALQAPELGAAASAMPSDEVTRRHLHALGREPDWRRLEAAAPPEAALEIDLGAVEPMVAAFEEPRLPRPLAGETRRVSLGFLVGPSAGYGDLARLARAVEGRRVHAGAALIVEVGSRQLFATAERDGLVERLSRAGARVLDGVDPAPLPLPVLRGAPGLCAAAADLDEVRDRPGLWREASVESCASAALEGRITDPRGVAREGEPAPEEPESFAVDEGSILKPAAPGAEPAIERGPSIRPLPAVRALEGALGGPVLLALGDAVSTDDILPRGARLEARRVHAESLAAFAFRAADPELAARARAHGGGFVVAGSDYGRSDDGGGGTLAALVTSVLGIHAVLAASHAPAHRKRLVEFGVLPLRFADPRDRALIARGDELELPGLPEALERGRSLALRHLTRGCQLALAHDLDPHELEVLRAGGLLAWSTAAVAAGR